MKQPQAKKYIIDATGKIPGRIATEIAGVLMGKNRTDFARNRIPDVSVEVISSSKMILAAKKLKDKMYYHHSLFPGGLKKESQGMVVKTKGAKEVLRRAIYGMLPKNKLRAQMMAHLKIYE